jgi:hypothetical protein
MCTLQRSSAVLPAARGVAGCTQARAATPSGPLYVFNLVRRAISGMDVCVRKPLLVTTGADKTLRVWNYASKVCEQVRHFADEPLSVSLHPSGNHVSARPPQTLRPTSSPVHRPRACTPPATRTRTPSATHPPAVHAAGHGECSRSSRQTRC